MSTPRLHFLHISKAGGSALQAALTDVECRYEIVLHGHPTTLRDVPEGDGVFFFVRDPVSRFASAFLSRQRRGMPRYQGKHTEREVVAFSQFSTPNELACALSSADAERRVAAEHAMGGINHVRIHYADWFHGIDYLDSRRHDVFFVGFQERLAADFDALRDKLGLSDSVALPDDPVLAHRRPADQDGHLTDDAVANIEAWYGDDRAFYNHCLRIANEVNPAPWPR